MDKKTHAAVEIIKVKFAGTYLTPCQLQKNIKVGSVACVGHSEIGIASCKFCVSYKEENTYFAKYINEVLPIVSEVSCARPSVQLNLF